jgi:hypothetical protein
VLLSPIAPGALCASGGVRVDVGVDENGNGALDSSEITQTAVICNGSNPDAGTSKEAGGPEGGHDAGVFYTLTLDVNAPASGSIFSLGEPSPRGIACPPSGYPVTTVVCRTEVPAGASVSIVSDSPGFTYQGGATIDPPLSNVPYPCQYITPSPTYSGAPYLSCAIPIMSADETVTIRWQPTP